MNGHLRSSDVQLKADVRHTWGDDVTMGVTYKTDISDVAVAANMVKLQLLKKIKWIKLLLRNSSNLE